MCGRFAFYSPTEAVAALFEFDSQQAIEPRYNIAPTQYIAAVRRDANDINELVMLRWGLVPSWARDPSIGSRMINARAETVAEKPSFRSAYRSRRCLILADGFYEWHTEEGVKIPYFISQESGEPFAMAGLWERWRNRESDETIETTTIVTAAANDFLAQLHNRMPIVLAPDLASRWLGGDTELVNDSARVGPVLRAWPVNRKVNNARNNSPDLVDAVGESIRQVN